jgi:putative chitinase
MKITSDYLKAIAPAADATVVAGIVEGAPALFKKYGIDDQREVDYFFGQTACETSGFTRLAENLFYTSTARLRQVWPSRFKSDEAAAPYVRNPRKLANLVYGGRLGNTKPNDGYNFRGSSVIQTTGFTNFSHVRDKAKIDCVENPDLIRVMMGALEAGLVYWTDHGLSKFVVANDIVGLTKAIQGGTGGIDDRVLYTKRARAASTGWSPTVKDTTGWLKLGDEGDRVKAAQVLLNAHGYYRGGKLDGKFGDGMQDAVRHFQKDKGLTVDGTIGDATLAALQKQPEAPEAVHDKPDPGRGATQVGNDKRSLISILAGLFGAILGAIFRRKS